MLEQRTKVSILGIDSKEVWQDEEATTDPVVRLGDLWLSDDEINLTGLSHVEDKALRDDEAADEQEVESDKMSMPERLQGLPPKLNTFKIRSMMPWP